MSSIKNSLDLGFIITDDKFNVLYCNEYFNTNIIKTDILNKNNNVFQDINVDMDKNLYSVKCKIIPYTMFSITNLKYTTMNYIVFLL